MPEEVLLKTENKHTRAEIADYLRSVADKLEEGGDITLRSHGESVTMSPPASPTFEVKAEREGPTDAPGELSVEFEIEWDEASEGESGGDGTLEIE
jgi:amphi-Trp domain-containing protein